MNKNRFFPFKWIAILIASLAIGLALYWANRSPRVPLPEALGETSAGAGHQSEHHDPAESHSEEHVELSAESLRLAGIRIETVQTRALNRTLSIVGQVEATPQGAVHLNSRVTGRVLELRVGIGDTVQRGQIVAVLDSEEIHRAEVAYAQASRQVIFAKAELQRRKQMAALGAYSHPPLEEARTREAEMEATLRQAETELHSAQERLSEVEAQRQAERAGLARAEQKVQRANALMQEQLMARQEYEAILWEREIAHASVAQVDARVQNAQAVLQGAETQLVTSRRQYEIAIAARKRAERVYQGRLDTRREVAEADMLYRQALLGKEAALDELNLLGGQPNGGHKLVLRAPISGRITARPVSIGETVTPDKPLYDILNSMTLWVSFDLYQEDLPLVQKGQTVLFTSPSAPGRKFTCTVVSISDTLDPNLRTVKARCVITNTGGLLKPGVFVEGTLKIGKRTPRVAVPQEAIQTMRDKWVVFLLTEEAGVFRIQTVEVGEEMDKFVTVRTGLKAGDRIVVKNAHVLLAYALRGEMSDGHDH
jgi:cobalt-zinc-cadmium efflux system membrane fusion protein